MVLDDAYHYMKLRGLVGKHRSVHSSMHCNTGILPAVNHKPLQNGHVSVTEKTTCDVSQPKLLVWSSSDECGIERLAKSYRDHLSHVSLADPSESSSYLENMLYTLSEKRSKLPWKSYFVCDSVPELARSLPEKLSRPMRSPRTAPKLGFVFSGQGAQWHAMGRELFIYPVFKDSLCNADKFLRSLGCQWSLVGMFIRLALDSLSNQCLKMNFSET